MAIAADVIIVPASQDDLPAVLVLLSQAPLPREGVAEHFAEFLVARAGGAVVGAVGLELYGTAALLRSLVVGREWRGHGLGQRRPSGSSPGRGPRASGECFSSLRPPPNSSLFVA